MGKADPSGQPSLRVADVAAGKQQEPRFDITVTGHQWWWEVSYSGTPITTANQIHIPVGKPMLLRLASADVVHDLWILNLSRKTDMVPGSYNYLTLQADAPGTYQGYCAEFCGVEHAWMLIKTIAQPQAEYDAWIRQESQPAQPFPPASQPTPSPPPVFNATAIMLVIDRVLGALFFRWQFEGSPILYQHFFWSFGHPEVYVMILPAFGIISEVIPVFSRKVIFGYAFVAGPPLLLLSSASRCGHTTCSQPALAPRGTSHSAQQAFS